MTGTADARALAARLIALSAGQRNDLVRRLQEAEPGMDGGPARADRSAGPLPASFLQERLWLVEQLLPGTAAYVVPVAMRIRGPLDVERLRQAFDQVARRQEILRTALDRRAERLVQVVALQPALPWELIDLTAEPQVWAAVGRVLGAEVARGFDLCVAPLWRVRVLRLSTCDHILGLFLHHAVTDGWSNGLLLREVGAAYTSLADGSAPDLPLPALQYGDAAAWARHRLTPEREAGLLEYWSAQLADAPPRSELPADRPRRVGADRGAEHLFVVGPERVARLRAWARAERTSTFALMCAGMAGWVGRTTGVDDVVIGSPQTGRTHPALEGVLGPFVNSVALRLRLPLGTTGAQLLRTATRVAREAQSRAELPFEKVVERLRPPRSAACNPVFQLNLGVTNFPRSSMRLPGTTVEPVGMPGTGSTKFDLSLYLTEAADHWRGVAEYNADLYEPETVARHVEGMLVLLETAADAPDSPLDELVLPADVLPGNVPGAGGKPPARRSRSGPVGELGPRPRRRFMAPRDEWESAVAAVWSEILDVPAVGAHDDFFALGGHSMAGLLAMERLHARTGRAVPLTTLFVETTVEKLARALRAAGDVGERVPAVVPLTGSGLRPPLVLAHPVLGVQGIYGALVNELGRGRPVVGLQSDGVYADRAGHAVTLEELAAHYAAELVRVVPAGRYHLCGFSAAGRLAVAVADALDRRGSRVGAVVVLDTAPVGDVDPEPSLATVLARWLPFAPAEENLRGLGRADMIEATLMAGQRVGELPGDLSAAEFGVFCGRLELNGRAFAGYRTPRYGGPLTVFTRAAGAKRDLAAEWSRFPVGEIRTVAVPVESHLDFVDGPGVVTVARLLADQLAAAEVDGGEV